MAYCAIKRNRETGKLARVTTRNGNDSLLFNKIASIPHLSSTKDGVLEHYLNVLSPKFIDQFGDWTKDTALNPRAARKIVESLRGKVDDETLTKVEQRAVLMQNPRVVTRIEKESEYTDIEGDLYDTDLDSGNTYFLYDETVSDNVKLESGQTLDSQTDQSAEVELLNTNPNGIINFKSSTSGDLVVIKSGQKIENIENITYEKPFSWRYENGEPRLFFKTPSGMVTESYSEALQNTQRGDVEVGFVATKDAVEAENHLSLTTLTNDFVYHNGEYRLNNPSKFISILNIDSNSDQRTRAGLINYLIRKELLSGERVEVNGEYILKGYGNEEVVASLNAELAFSALENRLGRGFVVMDPNKRIRFIDKTPRGSFDLPKRRGGVQRMTGEELEKSLLDGKYKQLSETYEDVDDAVAALYARKKADEEEVSVGEDTKAVISKLRLSMLNILESLGIDAMAISSYLEKFNIKSGAELSAKGLADISRRIVALADMNDNVTLSEETAHFVIEAYKDQAAIEAILPDVVETDEYKQQAEHYREIYRAQTKDEVEVERLVRREIAGKLLAREFAARATYSPVSLKQRIRDIINRFITYIRSVYSGQSTQLRNVINRLADAALNSEVDMFDTSLLINKNAVMFSAANVKSDMVARTYINRLEMAMTKLRRHGVNTEGMDQAIDKMNRMVVDGSIFNGLAMYITIADGQANALLSQMKEAKSKQSKDPTKGWWSLASSAQLESMNVMLLPMLQQLRSEINGGDFNGKGVLEANKVLQINKIDAVVQKMTEVNGEVARLNKMDGASVVGRLMAKWGVPESSREMIREKITKNMKDTTWITRMFGSLEHTSNPILSMLMMEISEAAAKATHRAREMMLPHFRQIDEKGIGMTEYNQIIERDHTGEVTGFLTSRVKLGEYTMAMKSEEIRAYMEATDRDTSNFQPFKTFKDYRAFITSKENEWIKPLLKANGEFDAMRIGDRDIRNKYSNTMDKWYNENDEHRYVDEYYKRQEEYYEDVANLREEYIDRDEAGAVVQEIKKGDPIAEETKFQLQHLNGRRLKILRKYRDATGKIDWMKLYDNQSDVELLNNINHDRMELKSEFNTSTGQLKSGIDMRIAKDIQAIDSIRRDVTEEVRRLGGSRGAKVERINSRTWQITMHSGRIYEYTTPDREIQDAFFEKLHEIQSNEGNQRAYEFLRSNGRLTFNDTFWDDLKSGKGFNDAFEEALVKAENIFSREYLDMMDKKRKRLNDHTAMRAELLKAHSEYNSTGEIAYQSMGLDTVARIKEITEVIDEERSVLSNMIATAGVEFNYKEFTENEVNEAYHKAYKDSSEAKTGDESVFAEKHMTDSNRRRLLDFSINLKQGKYSKLSSHEIEFLAKFFGDESLKGADLIERLTAYRDTYGSSFKEITGAYARGMVLPYFKRFAPAGYDQLLNDMRNGAVNMDYLVSELRRDEDDRSGVLRYMDIVTQNDWYEGDAANDKYLNPEYSENSEFGYHQPRLSKYRNNDYFNKFGIVKDADGVYKATKEQQLHELIDHFKEIKRLSLENYHERDLNYHNLYYLPQVSKTTYQKLFDEGAIGRKTGRTLRSIFHDIASVRVDDPMYGQTADMQAGLNLKEREMVMPKYYIAALEEPYDIATDLAYSYAMLAYQSSRYEANMDAIGNVMGLEAELQKQQFGGVENVLKSQAYQMFKEWVNYHFYGRRMKANAVVNVMGVDLDLAKIVHGISNFVGTVHVGMSPIIAATASTTNAANLAVERAAEQYVDGESFSRGMREAQSMMGSYYSEYGAAHKKSRLNVMGEHFGIYEFRSRIENAGYSKMKRAAIRAAGAYSMTDLFNSPYSPTVMSAILSGFRLVNGHFINYREFRNLPDYKGLSKAEIKHEWSKWANRSLYDCIVVNESTGELSYAERFMDMEHGGVTKEVIDNAVYKARRQILLLNQKCDGTLSSEDQSTISRNMFASSITKHRGWMSTTFARRWRAEGYNFSTGQIERGSYRTLIDMITKIVTQPDKKSVQGFIDAAKKYWGEMSDHDRLNLKRVGIDVTYVVACLPLMMLIAGWMDDEDERDSWIAQFVGYIGLRTISEMNSQNEPFLFRNVLDSLKQPSAMMKQVNDLVTLKNWSMEEITSGKYAGHSRLFRLANEQWYFKHWFTIKNPENLYKSSSYFRIMNEFSLPLAQKEGKEE
jgi:hypothetical protein